MQPPDDHNARTATCTFAGLTIHLHPTPTAHAPALDTLFAADIHLGKSAAFRAAGIPVPESAAKRDLDTLSLAIARTKPQQLVILGDLVHNRAGLNPRTIDTVTRWRQQHAQLAITLINGNHDRHAGALPKDWRITPLPPGTTLGPLALLHDPQDHANAAAHNLAGHIHPAVRLHDPHTRTATRLPAFIQSPHTLTLPAFSHFTGSKLVRPTPSDRVYPVCPDAVLALNPHARSA